MKGSSKVLASSTKKALRQRMLSSPPMTTNKSNRSNTQLKSLLKWTSKDNLMKKHQMMIKINKNPRVCWANNRHNMLWQDHRVHNSPALRQVIVIMHYQKAKICSKGPGYNVRLMIKLMNYIKSISRCFQTINKRMKLKWFEGKLPSFRKS